MTQRRVGHAAIDVGERGERRIHQHDARRDAGVEMIVDLRGVEAGDADAGKEMVQQRRAGLGKFVENERCAKKFGEDGEQSGSRRRLQHHIRRRDRGGDAHSKSERDRRRELLKSLALLRAARMRGEKARDLFQHRQHGGG